VLSEAGHEWIGVDISPAMLQIAAELQVDGDVLLGDLGEPLPFRPGSFDGAISVSALQWLCQADRSCHSPIARLRALFTSLHAVLARGARAVFQFYPEDSRQIELVTNSALRCGFTGGIVVDYPNSTKAKKVYLVLMTGGMLASLPQGRTGASDSVEYGSRREREKDRKKSKKHRPKVGTKEWVVNKKDRQRRQGKEVRPDSKYTGRRRPTPF